MNATAVGSPPLPVIAAIFAFMLFAGGCGTTTGTTRFVRETKDGQPQWGVQRFVKHDGRTFLLGVDIFRREDALYSWRGRYWHESEGARNVGFLEGKVTGRGFDEIIEADLKDGYKIKVHVYISRGGPEKNFTIRMTMFWRNAAIDEETFEYELKE